MRLARVLRGMLRVLTRPVRRIGRRGGLVFEAYRGYGSREDVFVIGRVFRQPGWKTAGSGLIHDLIDLGRLFLRYGVAGARVEARFSGSQGRFTTDDDGYFRVHLRPEQPPPDARLWHSMALQLDEPETLEATVEIYIPPPTCRFLVISDIDDTIMSTGVANKLKMLWRLFVEDAQSRVAFPGVASFLQALHLGRSGGEMNPMLYVSRAPWSIYQMLDEFFNLHQIPIGPLLFLREWGLTFQHPLPRRAEHHKRDLIEHMLAIYADLPVVLIGDSGQRDPEIYAQVVSKYPKRIIAVYIRNVSRNVDRPQAIESLAGDIADAGSAMLLAANTEVMTLDAIKRGLIAPAGDARVRPQRERSARG
jgi:phosphatidate phosphatase APP1